MASPDAKRVEFIGLPSPFADPFIKYQLAMGRVTGGDRQALWKMERKRQEQGFCRFYGATERIWTPAEGMSQVYVFGKFDFVQLMEPHDIEVLMNHHPANKRAYRVLDEIVVVR